MHFLTGIFIIAQLNLYVVLSQRDFANPAVTDIAPCSCDVQIDSCDPNCCCDSDCQDSDLSVSPVCQSGRTSATYSYVAEPNEQTWNCSNGTSATQYDYFPFVCVQFQQNEVKGSFYTTKGVIFATSSDNIAAISSQFVSDYPELFQATTLTVSSGTNYSIGSPVKQTSTSLFTLPGNLVGMTCQDNVNVLFGIDRDFSCLTSSLTNFCSAVSAATTFMKGGDTVSSVTASTFYQTASSSTTSRDRTSEYYFQTTTTPNIDNIAYVNVSIDDYCPGRYPSTRTQRYQSVCSSSDTTLCTNNQYQTWSGCPRRDSLSYSTIDDSFFSTRATSTDDSINFSDFSSPTSGAISCTGNPIQRILYRFNYLSASNTISDVQIYVLFAATSTAPTNTRITFQWLDNSVNSAQATTVPRGYLDGELLQFQRKSATSDVSVLVPTGEGLCIDANPTALRYKRSISSSCYVQLQQATVKQCYNLKLNMYLYLNTYYAPASHVFAYPSTNATPIQIRDTNQDQLDLNFIDQTRSSNLLSRNYIVQTSRSSTVYSIYDAANTLAICYGVPSGIYIEFGYVRVQVSPTVWFERIVSVQYNYTYSTWEFDCTKTTCTSSSTLRYPVTFQSAFIDLTGPALNFSTITKADLTSSDQYVQHLLWTITPEYKGEPGYRNYTIAMILIFIAMSIILMHVLLFGLMFPF